jgi:hypothetical protein
MENNMLVQLDTEQELKELARVALVNAFYYEFSELVQRTLNSAEGLGIGDLEDYLQENSSVYSRADVTTTKFGVVVLPEAHGAPYLFFPTLAEALKSRGRAICIKAGHRPTSVYKRIFVWKNGGWFYEDDGTLQFYVIGEV